MKRAEEVCECGCGVTQAKPHIHRCVACGREQATWRITDLPKGWVLDKNAKPRCPKCKKLP